MNIFQVKYVQANARRLLDAIDAVELKYEAVGNQVFWGCSETSQLKRTSMDLTKALAVLRGSTAVLPFPLLKSSIKRTYDKQGKISAIKKLRVLTGVVLKDAKKMVDRWEGGWK